MCTRLEKERRQSMSTRWLDSEEGAVSAGERRELTVEEMESRWERRHNKVIMNPK